MPQPRNITPKRLGKSSAKAFTDSSQGRAMEQPAPFRTTRREKALERNCEIISMLLPKIGFDQFAAGRLVRGRLLRARLAIDAAVEELRGENDGVHHAA